MPKLQLTLNPSMVDELTTMQTLLAQPDKLLTANLLMSLGAQVIREALKGGQVGIVHESKNEYRLIEHQVLDNIRQILSDEQ